MFIVQYKISDHLIRLYSSTAGKVAEWKTVCKMVIIHISKTVTCYIGFGHRRPVLIRLKSKKKCSCWIWQTKLCWIEKRCLMSPNLGWTPQESLNLDSLGNNYSKVSALTMWNVLLIQNVTSEWKQFLLLLFLQVNLHIWILITAVTQQHLTKKL